MLAIQKLGGDLIDILGGDAVVRSVGARWPLVRVPKGLRDEVEVIARDTTRAEDESLPARLGDEVLDGHVAGFTHLAENVLQELLRSRELLERDVEGDVPRVVTDLKTRWRCPSTKSLIRWRTPQILR